MDWSQIIYLLLLLIGSGAAASRDRWLLVIVMWINLAGTLSLNEYPMMVGIIDFVCVAALLSLGGKREYIVAGLFAFMIAIYAAAETIGNATTYGIVDVVAFAQIFVMGSGGFGRLFRGGARSILDLFAAPIDGTVGLRNNTDVHSQGDMVRDKKRGDQE